MFRPLPVDGVFVRVVDTLALHVYIRYFNMNDLFLLQDKMLSLEEVSLVYQKKFGAVMTEHYPFCEGKRQLCKSNTELRISEQKRPTEKTVVLPIYVGNDDHNYTLLNFSIYIGFRPEMSVDICNGFLRLCDLKYPFGFVIDQHELSPRNSSYISEELKYHGEDFF